MWNQEATGGACHRSDGVSNSAGTVGVTRRKPAIAYVQIPTELASEIPVVLGKLTELQARNAKRMRGPAVEMRDAFILIASVQGESDSKGVKINNGSI